jgi:hypothetical protein
MFVLLAQFAALGAWLVHPGLLVAAIAAVSLPVIIHLFNRRRYRIVEWAAIDFLLAAEKQNRRRIQTENLLLLLLRCLAVLLIGLVLARPFVPTSITAGLISAAPYERLVLLDDSASMQARAGHQSAFELARQRLNELVADLARQPGDNRLTLLLASQPDRPLVNAAPLTSGTLDEVQATIEKLQVSDKPALMSAALDHIESDIEGPSGSIHRALYVLTDLRQRDWLSAGFAPGAAKSDSSSPLRRLAQLSLRFNDCRVIDAAEPGDGNLTILAVHADGPLAAGVPAAIEVKVFNQGTRQSQGGSIKLTVDGALPAEQRLVALEPADAATLRFPLTLGGDEETGKQSDEDPPPRRITIELKSVEPAADDLLNADSTAYFAAQVKRGTRVLLVDGDPSTTIDQSEAYYLQRALAPPGQVRSGILADTATADELGNIDLGKYEVLFLLNTSQLGLETESNIASVERWVAAGGGLVIMPGDAVDAASFNRGLWREGKGLAPLPLAAIAGDDRRETWAGLEVTEGKHEVFAPFLGQNNPLLVSTKVFRWWTTDVKPKNDDQIAVPLRLTEDGRTVALAEKSLGRGRVCQFAFPADADWTTWPADPSYLLVMQGLVRNLARDRAASPQLLAGQPIQRTIDVVQFEPGGVLTGPGDLHAELQAAPPKDAADKDATQWQMEYAEAPGRGFYELELKRRQDGTRRLLLAANIDPAEGDLKRVPDERLRSELAGSRVVLVQAAAGASLASRAARVEIWRYALWLLAGVLAAEQVLGWLFGRWRT